MEQTDATVTQSEPKWKPISTIARRVLGVLVEKAKTTPNNYPLSLNAVTTGCNQKSNRDPHMDVSADDVEDTLEQLREWGAVGEVHGDGRVIKFRHYLKEWLGVDGTELAVMAELLLRGSQTVGELRGRAARMSASQLPDVAALRPVIAALIDKKLLIALTPAGRGQIVTHALYPASELSQARAQFGSGGSSHSVTTISPTSATTAAPTATIPAAPTSANSAPPHQQSGADDLRAEVARLRDEVARLRKEIEDIWTNIGS